MAENSGSEYSRRNHVPYASFFALTTFTVSALFFILATVFRENQSSGLTLILSSVGLFVSGRYYFLRFQKWIEGKGGWFRLAKGKTWSAAMIALGILIGTILVTLFMIIPLVLLVDLLQRKVNFFILFPRLSYPFALVAYGGLWYLIPGITRIFTRFAKRVKL